MKWCRPAAGRALALVVHAMLPVSAGLLIDAKRMADASGLAVTIELADVPTVGDPIEAVTAGDDYELLFAGPPNGALPVPAARIGRFAEGHGLSLTKAGSTIPLPPSLGWLHG